MNLILLTIIVLLIILPGVLTQGFVTELAAVLGVLPTSQILLAGGGIIGIKLAILLRVLALLGLIDDHRVSEPAELEYLPSTDNLTATTEAPDVPEEASYYGLPDVFKTLGFGNSNNPDNVTAASTSNSTLKSFKVKQKVATSIIAPTANVTAVKSTQNSTDNTSSSISQSNSSLIHLVENDAAYFPIPGLKIGVDNTTGRSFLIFDESAVNPMVLVPATFASPRDSVVTEQPDQDLNEPDLIHANTTYLLYPLLPARFRHPSREDRLETGFASAANESQLLIRLANGSVVSGDRVKGIEIDTNLTAISSRQKRSQILDQSENRTIASTGRNISAYFSLISSLDSNHCISRLACEIGANPIKYGAYGTVVNNFFQQLDANDYPEDSDAHHYISQFNFGHKAGRNYVCLKGSECSIDLMPLIEPLNQL